MAFTTYRYVLTDRDGNGLGELTGATGRSLQRTLNGIDTASVTISLTDPVARYLLLDPDKELLLRVYRQQDGADPLLVFHGPVVDVETVFGPSSGSAQINAASPVWWLTHRLAFKTEAGQVAVEVPKTEVKRANLVREAIDAARVGSGPLGLALDSYIPDSGTVTIEDVSWRSLAELLTEMSTGQLNASEGFDFWVEPSEYVVNGSVGLLRLSERRGQSRPGVIFETGIGTRNNAVEARQAITRGGMANVVYHVAETYSQDSDVPEAERKKVIAASQSASISVRGRHEAVLRDDIADDGYRQKLVDIHAAVRQRPRRVITFQPAPEEQGESVPKAIADYDVGDSIFIRVVAPDGTIAINDELRIYGIDTDIDDQSGTGRHTLTLSPQE